MDLEFTQKSLPELDLAQVRRHVADVEEIGEHMGEMFQAVVERFLAAGEEPGHPGVAWYAGDAEGLDIAAGFARPAVPGTETGHLAAAIRRLLVCRGRSSSPRISR